MIVFNNWQISVTGLIARQYDNPGTPGNGSDGGDGADGVLLIYY